MSNSPRLEAASQFEMSSVGHSIQSHDAARAFSSYRRECCHTPGLVRDHSPS